MRLVIAPILLAATASAATFHDASIDLRIELGGPDTKLCYVVPRELQDPAACAKQIAAAGPKLSPDMALFATMERAGHRYAVAGGWFAKPHDGPPTRDEALAIARGVTGYTLVDPEPRFFTIRNLSAVELVLASPGGAASIEYIIPSRDAWLAIYFIGDAAELPHLRAIASAAIATVTAPGERGGGGGHQLMLGVAVVVAAVGLGLFAVMWSRRRRLRDGDEVDVWAITQRRNAGLRIYVVGQLLLVPILFWLAVYADWDSNAPVTHIKVVGETTAAIGALLSAFGLVIYLRARRR